MQPTTLLLQLLSVAAIAVAHDAPVHASNRTTTTTDADTDAPAATAAVDPEVARANARFFARIEEPRSNIKPGLRLYYTVGADIPGPSGAIHGETDEMVCARQLRWDYSPYTAVTWSGYNGGTCWFKPHTAYAVPKAGTRAAITDVSSAAYKEFWAHDCDLPGNDLGSGRRAYPYECAGLCAATRGCYAVTWTNYNGGTCWLKSQGTDCVRRVGTESLLIFRDTAWGW